MESSNGETRETPRVDQQERIRLKLRRLADELERSKEERRQLSRPSGPFNLQTASS